MTEGRRRTGRRHGTLAAAALLACLAGCTSSAQHPARPVTPPAPVSTPATPTTAPASARTTARTTASSSTAASASHTSTAPVVSAPPIATPHSTCTSVTVRVIRGSASQGQEFAAVQFVNTGPARCVLVGYPSVTLLRGGKPIGQQSQPSSLGTSSRVLAPGAVAESRLHDYTQQCQAPLSDAVRVVVPGSSITSTRPQFQMRGCVLRVDKLGPPE